MTPHMQSIFVVIFGVNVVLGIWTLVMGPLFGTEIAWIVQTWRKYAENLDIVFRKFKIWGIRNKKITLHKNCFRLGLNHQIIVTPRKLTKGLGKASSVNCAMNIINYFESSFPCNMHYRKKPLPYEQQWSLKN